MSLTGSHRALAAVAAVLALAGVLTALVVAGDGGDGPGAAPTAPTSTTSPLPSPTTTADPAPAPPAGMDLVAEGVVAPVPADGPVLAVELTDLGLTLPVVETTAEGWRVRTPCDATALVAITRPATVPLRGAHVVVDPGHGGDEPGAIGPAGTAEKHLNTAVAGATAAALRARGLTVALTRAADHRVAIVTRTALVQALRPAAFVSIHFNAEPDGTWPSPGSETYFQVASPESRRLSGLVYEEAVATLAPFDVAWVADTDAGAKYRRRSGGDDYYAVLRRAAGVPSVLAELAFVSNPPEEALLGRPEVQQRLGEAVARGVERFLRGDQPGDVFTDPYPRETPAGGGGGTGGCVDPPI